MINFPVTSFVGPYPSQSPSAQQAADPKRILLMTVAPPTDSPLSTSEKRYPLGLAFLVSALRDRGHEVLLRDNYLFETAEGSERIVLETEVDFVGLYLTTICFGNAVRMLTALEEMRHSGAWSGTLMVGGPHTSVCLEAIPDFVDYIVQGEGEEAIVQIVEGTATERVLQFKRSTGLDGLPRPAYDYFQELPYLVDVPWFKRKPIFTMNTSRGCPYPCTFCSVGSIAGKRYFSFSPGRIVDDIRYLVETFGMQGIYFREDIFSLKQDRVHAICDLLLTESMDVLWVCETRVDCLTDELLKKMHAAGCRAIYFGVESGNQEVLDFYKKGITVEQIEWAFAACHRIGIHPVASCITGVPYEGLDDDASTEALLERIKPGTTWLNPMLGLPGTALYDQLDKDNAYKYRDENGLLRITS